MGQTDRETCRHHRALRFKTLQCELAAKTRTPPLGRDRSWDGEPEASGRSAGGETGSAWPSRLKRLVIVSY